MSERKDGGPAFPTDSRVVDKREGMSLRDWLAGQALVGVGRFIAGPEDPAPYAKLAEDAYKLADAMLAERAKSGGA